MAGIIDLKEKHVVPVWGSSRELLVSPESLYLGQRDDAYEKVSESVEFTENWSTFQKAPNSTLARSILGLSVTLNKAAEGAVAADFLESSGEVLSEVDRKLCALIRQQISWIEGTQVEEGIGRIRTQLKDYPKQPFLWLDLARLYASEGLHDRAKKAIKVAVTLAPSNRLIVRSASRYFLSNRELDTGLSILKKSYQYDPDPFIAAPLISFATIADLSLYRVGVAKTQGLLAKSGLALPELLSSIGMLEYANGRDKKAKKFLSEAWKGDMPESVVTHAEWITRTHLPEYRKDLEPTFESSFEAMAMYYFNKHDLTSAIRCMESWISHEPFLIRSYTSLSHMLLLQQDYEGCQELTTKVLLKAPSSFLLNNNLVFALARQGNGPKAKKRFESVKKPSETEHDAVYLATSGLVDFANGDPDTGAQKYESAIKLFKKKGDRRGLQMALLYYLETLLQFGVLDKFPEEEFAALKSLSKSPAPEIRILYESLRDGSNKFCQLRRPNGVKRLN